MLRRSWAPLGGLSGSRLWLASAGKSKPGSASEKPQTTGKGVPRASQKAPQPRASHSNDEGRQASNRVNAPSGTAATQSSASPTNASATESSSSTSSVPPQALFDRCAAARREAFDLWNASSGGNAEGLMSATQRTAKLKEILERYRLHVSTPREEDVTRGIGEAFDRLLLLCVPLSDAGGTELLDTLLACAGRSGREISVRTIQHLFARSATYAEAIALFYSLRRSNVAMTVEAYHAMLYSLQRLEEESWAQKFHAELHASSNTTPSSPQTQLSESAMTFILQGCAHQLIPEAKPWLGSLMYGQGNRGSLGPDTAMPTADDFDRLGKTWAERYRAGARSPAS